MNRLQAELQRLYPPDAAQGVRTLVLELAGPASWKGLAPAWRGVQGELELPAPAIAVSGVDGYQLWFSLSQAVPIVQAIAFLESLRKRYLGDIARERIAMEPSIEPSSTGRAQRAELPPLQREAGRWSAFVAPDLAALFEDEPWLDLAPGPDAQADLLSRLASAKPDAFARALERLESVDAPASTKTPSAPAGNPDDPRRFLLAIMNDPAVDLQMRIEAAKALLPYFEGQRPN